MGKYDAEYTKAINAVAKDLNIPLDRRFTKDFLTGFEFGILISKNLLDQGFNIVNPREENGKRKR